MSNWLVRINAVVKVPAMRYHARGAENEEQAIMVLDAMSAGMDAQL